MGFVALHPGRGAGGFPHAASCTHPDPMLAEVAGTRTVTLVPTGAAAGQGEDIRSMGELAACAKPPPFTKLCLGTAIDCDVPPPSPPSPPLSSPAAGGRSPCSAQALSSRPTQPGNRIQQNQKTRCDSVVWGERTALERVLALFSSPPFDHQYGWDGWGRGGFPCKVHRLGVSAPKTRQGASGTPG